MPSPGMRSSLVSLASSATFCVTGACQSGAPTPRPPPLEVSTRCRRRPGSFGLGAPRSEHGMPVGTPLQKHRSKYQQAWREPASAESERTLPACEKPAIWEFESCDFASQTVTIKRAHLGVEHPSKQALSQC